MRLPFGLIEITKLWDLSRLGTLGLPALLFAILQTLQVLNCCFTLEIKYDG
jgi:hypothetical protein